MARQRSPNCPQIAFSEAIERGRKVYHEEHTYPAAKIAVAKDLGYSGLNGRSLTLIGSLRQYGILEGSGDALRVSDAAVAYYELQEGPERQQAISQMVFKPALFAEMKEQFGDVLPSEANLKHWLIKKSFLPKAAADIIRVYKANLELATGEESVYIGDENNAEESPMSNTPNFQPGQHKLSGVVQTYSFALSADTRAELSIRGTVNAEELEMLRDQVELTIKALTRKAKEHSQ